MRTPKITAVVANVKPTAPAVNRAGVDIILRMRHRLEALSREMEEMMDYLEKDIRTTFEKRIKEAFEEEES